MAAVAAAAMLIDRPLKWTEDRLENLVGRDQGRGTEGDLELALDERGRCSPCAPACGPILADTC